MLATRSATPACVCCLVVAGLAGCASDSSIEMLAPGTYAVDCSGGAPTWAVCHSLADRACEGGDFEIQSQVSNAGAGVGTNDWSMGGSQITRSMVVRCK
jgi:hypothetical protein